MTVIRTISQNKRFPKGVHFGQVTRPIDLGHIHENRTNQRVNLYFFVKRVYQHPDRFRRIEQLFGRIFFHRLRPTLRGEDVDVVVGFKT